MLLRLLLSLVVAGCGAWAQDQKVNGDVQSIPLRTHSLSAPYLDSDMQSRWWDFGGSTLVRTDQYIRLTAERPSQAGWIFSRVPLTATNWEIELEFKITGKGNLYGDGFAMWLTKQRALGGDVFGFVDKFEGLGIFFDTYKNNRPGVTFPYVMAMMGDGQTEYDKGNDGKANELGGCSARGIRNKDIPTKAKITYFQDQSLKMELQYKREDEWTPCFEIPNVKIPTVAYLGFSAETGELSDNHDIISVNTKNLYDTTNRGPSRKAGNEQRKGDRAKNIQDAYSRSSSGGGRGFFGWMLPVLKTVVVVCTFGGIAYIAYTTYRTRQRRGYSRF